MNRRIAVLIGTLAAVPSALSAQGGSGGQLELAGYGVYSWFDDDAVAIDDEVGAGGRLAVYFNRYLSLETWGDYSSTNVAGAPTEVTVTRLGASLLAHIPFIGANRIYLGGGYERTFYRSGLDAEENGAHAVVGDRIPLGSRAAFRIEGRGSLYPSSSLVAGQDQAINLSASVGLSVFLFGGPPSDTDGDGVSDRDDLCSATPAGAVVDVDGCPQDGDRDRVLDGLDRCPDTPIGATIDAAGCHSDSDSDGVFDGLDVCANTPAGARVDGTGCPFDSDADGVVDGIDACDATPAGATVAADGCPVDSDGDGVFDGIDTCPGTPRDVTVNARGCPTDTDADGVIDTLDACPDTPAGARVDSRGCARTADRDGDGVPDNADRCPGTAPGRQVDSVGCPVLFELDAGGDAEPLVLQGVTFRFGSAELTGESERVLDEVAASLIAHPDVRVEIGGHTDAIGSRSRNIEISIRRAESVRDYLVSKGVDPSRLEARGYGPDRPVASNSSREGRARNRRVELRRLPE